MKKTPFCKYTSCGNNFVIIDEVNMRVLTEAEKSKFAYPATNMNFGVGSDNFIVVQHCSKEILYEINSVHRYWNTIPDADEADFIFRMFEPNGKEALCCGNGLLCISDLLFHRHGITSGRIMTEIPSASPTVIRLGMDTENRLSWVKLAPPRRIPHELARPPFVIPCDDAIDRAIEIKISIRNNTLGDHPYGNQMTLSGYLVHTGEPHLVIFTDTDFWPVELADSLFDPLWQKKSKGPFEKRRNFGARLLHLTGTHLNQDYTHFLPEGININFARKIGDSPILEYRTFERGINRETLACGTGAVAVSFVARYLGICDSDRMVLWPHRCRQQQPDAEIIVSMEEKRWNLYSAPQRLLNGEFLFTEAHDEDTIQDLRNHQSISHEPKRVAQGYRIKANLLIAATTLLIIAIGFNALLSLGTLEKLYLESMASRYRVVGKDLQRKLEQSLRYGKNINAFVGMKRILLTANSNLKKFMAKTSRRDEKTILTNISIGLPDGTILYSTDEKFVGVMLSPLVIPDYGVRPGEVESEQSKALFTKMDQSILTTLPLHDMGRKWVGTLLVEFDRAQVEDLNRVVVRNNLKIILVILIVGTLLLALLLNAVLESKGSTKGFPRRKVAVIVTSVICLSQIVFSVINAIDFKNYYLQINREKVEALSMLLKNDIEFFLSKGLGINRLSMMEDMMGKIISASPELDDIILFNRTGRPLYMATKNGVHNFKEGEEPRGLVPSKNTQTSLNLEIYRIKKNDKEEGITEGYISAHLSMATVFVKLRLMAMDSLTVLVISIFFFMELLILMFQFVERSFEKPEETHRSTYKAMRPAAFLFLFGVDLSISFLPLHMEKLYTPIFGLSKDIVLGLPISVEMFFVGITLFIAGIWLDRRGWHEPFLMGLLITGMGGVYSWLALDAVNFIASRGIVGIGYGLSLMAAQGFVVGHSGESSKARGFAHLFAGVYAGSMCGGAAGAMLAERAGYQPVFFISAIVVLSVILYTVILMRSHFITPRRIKKHEKRPAKPRRRQLLFFVFNRNIIGLLFLASLPSSIAVVGFLYYFCPIYLNRIGISQSNIGRIFMIYGVCLILIAPYISKYIDESRSKKKYIIIGGILGSLGFFVFGILRGESAIALAFLTLGLSSSFDASKTAYILRLRAAQELGEGKALGVISSVGRVGQVLGPLVFGWLTLILGIEKGITCFGAFYVLVTLLFVFLVKNDKRRVRRETDQGAMRGKESDCSAVTGPKFKSGVNTPWSMIPETSRKDTGRIP